MKKTSIPFFLILVSSVLWGAGWPGLFGLGGAGVLGWVGVRIRTEVWKRNFEAGGRRFLWALRGLLTSGVGFGEAFESLGRAEGSDPFSQAVREAVIRWGEGRGLHQALAPLEVGDMGGVLRGLQVAYYQGRPVLPYLEEWLPRLERQADFGQRAFQLRAAMGAQCVVVVGLPWLVGMGMGGTLPWGLALAVVGWQGLGLGVVAWVSRP